MSNTKLVRNFMIPNPSEIASRLMNIKPGEWVTYYVGHLGEDRTKTPRKFVPELDLLHLENARIAWENANAHLVQRRRQDDAGFDYIAVGRK
jgi:hypothetical protein